MKNLPPGVRCVVYSYLTFENILAKSCKLSKKERKNLMLYEEILHLDRNLLVSFQEGKNQNGYEIAIDLATKIRLKFEKFDEKDVLLLQKVMSQSHKFYQGIEGKKCNSIDGDDTFDVKLFVKTI